MQPLDSSVLDITEINLRIVLGESWQAYMLGTDEIQDQILHSETTNTFLFAEPESEAHLNSYLEGALYKFI